MKHSMWLTGISGGPSPVPRRATKRYRNELDKLDSWNWRQGGQQVSYECRLRPT